LEAFRRDVVKQRYADWNELIDYCRYSAMPVGRYVLDVHGEDRASWPYNDALCAALQVINHLQDCGKDFREIDRVYLPQDVMARHGAAVEMLGEPQARAALKAVLHEVAMRNAELLVKSAAFAGQIRDGRLALEVAMIQRFAEDLNGKLLTRDQLLLLAQDNVVGKGALGLAELGVRPTPADLLRASDATGIPFVELLEALWGIEPSRLADELALLGLGGSAPTCDGMLSDAESAEVSDFVDFLVSRHRKSPRPRSRLTSGSRRSGSRSSG